MSKSKKSKSRLTFARAASRNAIWMTSSTSATPIPRAAAARRSLCCARLAAATRTQVARRVCGIHASAGDKDFDFHVDEAIGGFRRIERDDDVAEARLRVDQATHLLHPS